MLLKSPDDIFRHGVSPSMISTWLTCRKQWYNHYVRGLKGEGSDATMFGTSIHEFLASYYNKSVTSEEAFVKNFKKSFTLDMESEKKPQDLGVKLIKNYLKIYPLDTEPFKVVSVEENKEGIKVPIDGLDVPLHFIPDMIVEREWGLEVWDHKTSSILGSSYFDQFINCYQVYSYLYGMNKKLGEEIKSMTINAIGTKKKVDSGSFMRNSFAPNKSQIDYHMRQFVLVASEMIRVVRSGYKDPERFYMHANGSSCRAFFTKCLYLEMCEYNDSENFAESLKVRLETKKDEKKNPTVNDDLKGLL